MADAVFILQRCPRCLAPFTAPERLEQPPNRHGVGCVSCGNLGQAEADSEYDRRLAQSRVVARMPATYEPMKRP